VSLIARSQRNILVDAGLLLGHLVHLLLLALNFFFWWHIEDAVHVSPLAATLPELAGRIRDAVATVILDLFNNVWTETE
jgi:hypothetical protein